MKITTEDLGDRQVLLTLEVDEERVDKALRGAARKISRQYNFPGFRRGRAPYDVILRRFGREALLQEALDDLGEKIIGDALKREDLKPYGPGELQDIQLTPLVLKLRVPLQPLVELGDYRELRVEPPLVTVEEEKMAEELERLRQANAMLEPADDRPAKMGDMVLLDVEADLEDEIYVDEESYELVLDTGEEKFAPGFSEQIVGMAVGEEKSFTLALPEDDEDMDDDLVGKEADFTVKLHQVKNRIVPGVDDDLARTVGDYDTLEELQQSIQERLEQQAQAEADQAYTEEVIETLVAQATVEYPPDALEDQVNSQVEGLEKRMEGQGIALEDFYKLTGQTQETIRDSLRPQAEKNIVRALVLSELAYQEKLSIDKDKVNERIAAMSAPWGERAGEVQQMLATPDGVRSVTNELLVAKAIRRMVAIAKGEAPPLEEEEEESDEESSEEPQEIQAVDEAANVQENTEETPEEQAETPEADQTEV